MLQKIIYHFKSLFVFGYQISIAKRFASCYIVMKVVHFHMDGGHIARINDTLHVASGAITPSQDKRPRHASVNGFHVLLR